MSKHHWKPLISERAQLRDGDSVSLISNPHMRGPGDGGAEYKRYNVFSSREWGLEMLSTVVSLACLCGIAAIFWCMHDQPLSHWTFPFSLNATISLLTTACGAAMMHNVSAFISQLKWLHFKKRSRTLFDFEKFDMASRGSLGSVKFLFGVGWNLATLGALITICRLSLASLTQQVVEIGDREVATPDSNATFGYAHLYRRELDRELANAGDEGIPQDPKMQAAILQGLYDISTFARFSCTTGSCAWNQTVVSIGFKSACTNVTQATLKTADCSGSEESYSSCNLTTPGGLGIFTQRFNTEYATTFYLNATAVTKDAVDEAPGNSSEIAKLAVYRSSPLGFNAININVTECTLSLAAYEYTEAKSNGTTFEFEKTKEIDLGKNAWKIDSKSTTGLPDYSTNASKSNDIPSLAISRHDLRALQNFFESNTFVTEWVEGNYKNRNIAVSPALNGEADIPRLMSKMATSMTDYLRSGPNSKTATGQRVEMVTYVTIRWLWFIGPVAIELASLLFAMATMVSNRKSRRVPLWKSSALAILSCEDRSEEGLIRTGVKDIKRIRDKAERSQVRLE